MHIVKAVTLAYATLAHLPHQEPCLRTSLKHIRLFPAKDVAETNITLGAYRPGNRLGLKLIPWSLAAHSAERYGSFRESVKCIHGGGTYSDLQVLGHQLLGLSCSLQMKEFRERENALKDLYQGFGEHVHELISLMLQDSSWQTLFSKIKEAELGSSHTYNTDCSKSYIEIHKSQIPQQIILHQPIMSPLTPTKAGNQSPQLKNCRVLQGNPQTGLGSLKNRASQQLDSQLVDTFRNGAKMIFTPSLKSQQNTHLVGVPKIHYDPKTKIDFDRKGIEKSRQCPTE